LSRKRRNNMLRLQRAGLMAAPFKKGHRGAVKRRRVVRRRRRY